MGALISANKRWLNGFLALGGLSGIVLRLFTMSQIRINEVILAEFFCLLCELNHKKVDIQLTTLLGGFDSR